MLELIKFIIRLLKGDRYTKYDVCCVKDASEGSSQLHGSIIRRQTIDPLPEIRTKVRIR